LNNLGSETAVRICRLIIVNQSINQSIKWPVIAKPNPIPNRTSQILHHLKHTTVHSGYGLFHSLLVLSVLSAVCYS